jgi:hypothetical protein
MGMDNFTLGIWIVTAAGGAYLWSFTTGVGRPESNARASRLPPSLLFFHPLLALAGLAVWIAYVVRDYDVLPWIAFADLVVVATLGDILLVRTLRGRREQEPAAVGADRRLAERQIPRVALVVHGVLAVTTMVCVLVVALSG